jgi:hypothetical protein
VGRHHAENHHTIRSQKPAYGDALTLLIKNQSTLYLQWNISVQLIKSLSIICNEPFAALYKTIRVYQVKGDSISYKEINITENKEPFLFLEEIDGGAIYYAEFIVVQSRMNRLTILKSNEINVKSTHMKNLKWKTLDTVEADWKRHFSGYSAYE